MVIFHCYVSSPEGIYIYIYTVIHIYQSVLICMGNINLVGNHSWTILGIFSQWETNFKRFSMIGCVFGSARGAHGAAGNHIKEVYR